MSFSVALHVTFEGLLSPEPGVCPLTKLAGGSSRGLPISALLPLPQPWGHSCTSPPDFFHWIPTWATSLHPPHPDFYAVPRTKALPYTLSKRASCPLSPSPTPMLLSMHCSSRGKPRACVGYAITDPWPQLWLLSLRMRPVSLLWMLREMRGKKENCLRGRGLRQACWVEPGRRCRPGSRQV